MLSHHSNSSILSINVPVHFAPKIPHQCKGPCLAGHDWWCILTHSRPPLGECCSVSLTGTPSPKIQWIPHRTITKHIHPCKKKKKKKGFANDSEDSFLCLSLQPHTSPSPPLQAQNIQHASAQVLFKYRKMGLK